MNSTLYREPDTEARAMKVPDFEMKGKTGVFLQFTVMKEYFVQTQNTRNTVH